ncbi:hypothetical protein MHBO_004944, partial [Bonamia ostreae]
MSSIGYNAKVVDLEEDETKNFFDKKFSVFIVATFGDGDPTESAQEFWKWIFLNKIETDLANFNYAVFGLGNSQYEHFNATGKKLFRKLKSFGANPICKLGLGDDDDDIESDFKKWKEIFFDSFKQHLKPK